MRRVVLVVLAVAAVCAVLAHADRVSVRTSSDGSFSVRVQPASADGDGVRARQTTADSDVTGSDSPSAVASAASSLSEAGSDGDKEESASSSSSSSSSSSRHADSFLDRVAERFLGVEDQDEDEPTPSTDDSDNSNGDGVRVEALLEDIQTHSSEQNAARVPRGTGVELNDEGSSSSGSSSSSSSSSGGGGGGDGGGSGISSSISGVSSSTSSGSGGAGDSRLRASDSAIAAGAGERVPFSEPATPSSRAASEAPVRTEASIGSGTRSASERRGGVVATPGVGNTPPPPSAPPRQQQPQQPQQRAPVADGFVGATLPAVREPVLSRAASDAADGAAPRVRKDVVGAFDGAPPAPSVSAAVDVGSEDDSAAADTLRDAEPVLEVRIVSGDDSLAEGVVGVDVSESEVSAELVDSNDNRYVLAQSGKPGAALVEDHRLISDIILVLLVATCSGFLAFLARQPVEFGYVFAGAVLGPYGLAAEHEVVQLDSLSSFGLLFMMFSLGVNIKLGDILRNERVSITACACVAAVVALCIGIASVHGSSTEGIVLGFFAAIGSSSVVHRCVQWTHLTGTRMGAFLENFVVVQDLVLGLFISLMPVLQGVSSWRMVGHLVQFIVALALLAIGLMLVHRHLARALKFLLVTVLRSKELVLLGSLAFCLSFAVACRLLGLPMDLGAFIAGVFLSDVTPFASHARGGASPLVSPFAAAASALQHASAAATQRALPSNRSWAMLGTGASGSQSGAAGASVVVSASNGTTASAGAATSGGLSASASMSSLSAAGAGNGAASASAGGAGATVAQGVPTPSAVGSGDGTSAVAGDETQEGALLRLHAHVASTVEPVRDLFSALFYTQIGTTISLRFLAGNIGSVLLVTVTILVVKSIIGFVLLAFMARLTPSMALRGSLALAHVGEFGFVVVTKALALDILSNRVFRVMISSTLLSLLLVPLVFRLLFVYGGPAAGGGSSKRVSSVL